MIQQNIKILICLAISSFFWSCERAPELPSKPEIGFESISFEERQGQQDVIRLSITFKDNEGDLGLNARETDFPFHQNTFYNSANGQPVYNLEKFGGRLLQLGDAPVANAPTLPPYDFSNSRPEGDCANYLLFRSNTGEDGAATSIDTVYYEQNPNQYNIFVDFYRRRSGEWEFYNARRELCSEFHGRFFHLNTSSEQKPLEGTLTYNIESNGFRVLFGRESDTLMLKIRINDRALNTSNEIETPPFVLNDIRINTNETE